MLPPKLVPKFRAGIKNHINKKALVMPVKGAHERLSFVTAVLCGVQNHIHTIMMYPRRCAA
jgi:hypothetical protein